MCQLSAYALKDLAIEATLHTPSLSLLIVWTGAGPRGTWKGGREKVPAAFCRKACVSDKEFEVWGDGKQTRSFMFIDDCVEGSIKILLSMCEKLNTECSFKEFMECQAVILKVSNNIPVDLPSLSAHCNCRSQSEKHFLTS